MAANREVHPRRVIIATAAGAPRRCSKSCWQMDPDSLPENASRIFPGLTASEPGSLENNGPSRPLLPRKYIAPPFAKLIARKAQGQDCT